MAREKEAEKRTKDKASATGGAKGDRADAKEAKKPSSKAKPVDGADRQDARDGRDRGARDRRADKDGHDGRDGRGGKEVVREERKRKTEKSERDGKDGRDGKSGAKAAEGRDCKGAKEPERAEKKRRTEKPESAKPAVEKVGKPEAGGKPAKAPLKETKKAPEKALRRPEAAEKHKEPAKATKVEVPSKVDSAKQAAKTDNAEEAEPRVEPKATKVEGAEEADDSMEDAKDEAAAKREAGAEPAGKPEALSALLGVQRRRPSRRGPCAVAAELLEGGAASVSGGSCGSSYSGARSSSYSTYDSRGRSRSRRRRRRRDREGLRAASGFSAQLAPPPPPPPPGGAEARPPGTGAVTYGPAPAGSMALVPLAEKVRGLLDNRDSLAQEVARMKQAMQVASSQQPAASKEASAKAEGRETVLRMPPRLHENLLHPDNEAQLLARTGLVSASLNEDGLVVLLAASRKGLMKALGQLRRVAYHCQWGCSKQKVAALLAEKPARPVNTMVVRLAATSSRLQSFEARLTLKVRKLRIGTQAGACQMVVEGIPGLSRKHCTITFEPEKGACYVQDLSTNGTYFNGKRLPRPPYKNPQDARVRVFHGDELFFRLRSDDAEELGYVVNLLELS